MPPPVLDWSWARPDPAAMMAVGYEAVIRYVSYDDSKDMLAGERDRILNAGMDVGLVFEATAAGPLGGAGPGTRDGRRMFQRMQALGCPPGMCAYWAMDTNVSPSDWPALEDYGRTFLAELQGVYPAGHYGESDVIDHLMDLGLIDYGWFAGATSWSNGRITPNAHLVQRVGNAPAGTDRNDVQRTPWGSWLQAAAGLHTAGSGTPLNPATGGAQSEEDDMAQVSQEAFDKLVQDVADTKAAAAYLQDQLDDDGPLRGLMAKAAQYSEDARGGMAGLPALLKLDNADVVAAINAKGGNVTEAQVKAALTSLLTKAAS